MIKINGSRDKVKTRLYNLKDSFVYASSGILFCFKYEKNMRIHLIITLYVLFFSRFYDFSRAEFAIIVLICVVVMSLEMINTAIEVLVDKVSPHYHTLAKISKDVAAGAVFISAIAAAVVGFVLFYEPTVIGEIIIFFTSQLSNAALLLASAVLSVVFIISGKNRSTGSRVKNGNKK